jgi:hypothetical protein
VPSHLRPHSSTAFCRPSRTPPVSFLVREWERSSLIFLSILMGIPFTALDHREGYGSLILGMGDQQVFLGPGLSWQ